MNIDELIDSYSKSQASEVRNLATLLRDWKTSDRDVVFLEDTVERYFGNTWIGSKGIFELEYRKWKDFRNEAIQNIGGMTMNERLYWFSLAGEFESLLSENEKDVIYRKLEAGRI
jgi:hypothetical protein